MPIAPSRSRSLLCLLGFLCLFTLSLTSRGEGFILSSVQPGEGLRPPLGAAEPASPLRFAVIGDSGTGDEHQYLIAQRMAEWHGKLPFSLVLMLGDNIYGGTFGWGGGDDKDFATKFDQPYEALLTRGVVFRAALGNHDLRHRDGLDMVDSYDRFHIEHPNGYYSFTAGRQNDGAPLVEFFVLNTVRLEKDKEDPMQLEWLQRALGESRARWRIVYGHHPLHSTGRRHGADERMRAKLEPLFFASAQPRVHVVLAGHDHIYQRFQPQNGVAYFVCGSSGKLRRGNAEPDSNVAAVNDREHVFMMWEATPDELRFRAINEHGVAFDCGVLRHGQGPRAVDCAAD